MDVLQARYMQMVANFGHICAWLWTDKMFVVSYLWRRTDGKFVLLNKKGVPEGTPHVAANFAALIRDIYCVFGNLVEWASSALYRYMGTTTIYDLSRYKILVT